MLNIDNTSIAQKGLLVALIPLVCCVAVLVGLLVVLVRMDLELQAQSSGRQLVASENAMIGDLVDSMQNVLQFAYTGEERFLKNYSTAKSAANINIRKVQELVKNNSEQRDILAVQARLQKRMFAICDVTLDKAISGENMEFFTFLGVREHLENLMKAYAMKQSELTSSYANLNTDKQVDLPLIIRIIGCCVILTILLSFFTVRMMSRNITSRLCVVADNAVRLSKGQSLLRSVDGHDEVATLDRVFHEMATALMEAQEREKQIQAMKDDFVCVVSHDLRTPLTSVIASLSLLDAGAGGELNERGKHIVRRSEVSISRLISLINDLLDVDKLNSGKFELTYGSVAIDETVNKCVESVTTLASNKDVQINLNISGETRILADDARLTQVIMNLLSNAIKYSPAGESVNIDITTNSNLCRIAVSDKGPGVELEQQTKIFDKYHQVSDSAGTHKLGTGLGLPICKAIVEAHHGRILVKSAPGSGSTFIVEIPTAPVFSDAMA